MILIQYYNTHYEEEYSYHISIVISKKAQATIPIATNKKALGFWRCLRWLRVFRQGSAKNESNKLK